MSVLSGASGDDRLQVGMAVFAIVISLVVSMLLPICAPAYNVDTGYSYSDIFSEKASIESFTGESMTNMTPWKLTGVYTPWTIGDDMSHIDPETGWAYGESIDNYPYIGKTKDIKLDPQRFSDKPFAQASYKDVEYEITQPIQWYYNFNGDGNLNLIGQIAEFFGADTLETVTKSTDVNSWIYSGYRYEFDPMLKIDYSNPSGDDYQKEAQSDAKLSLIWYKSPRESGLSGGLVLYNNSTNGLISNILADDIVSEYNSGSLYSSKYSFDFDGVKVYLNFRFDLDVINGSYDLRTAFDEGKWSIAITALSMDNYMDLAKSNSLSNSAASIIDTYIQIYTLSFPNLDLLWSMVLWVICILPIQLTVLMFLSRFGIIGLGIGVLGSAVLTAFGLGGAL